MNKFSLIISILIGLSCSSNKSSESKSSEWNSAKKLVSGDSVDVVVSTNEYDKNLLWAYTETEKMLREELDISEEEMNETMQLLIDEGELPVPHFIDSLTLKTETMSYSEYKIEIAERLVLKEF